MDSARSEVRQQRKPVTVNDPAIGIVAEPDRGDEVAGAILRARQSNHDVLVLQQTPGFVDAVEYARQLGVTVVKSDTEVLGGEDPLDRLVEAAKERGYPGLIYQEDPADRVDVESSAHSLYETGAYLTEAHVRSVAPEAPEVLAAIPAFNESAAIGDVVRDAEPYADDVLVVDDGSDDDTARRARAAGATVIEHERNRGYGAALKTAFEEAERCRTSHLVVLDGDGQHDPSDIPALVDAQEDTDADIVIGSRFGEGSRTRLPVYRRLGLKVVNLLTNLSMGVVRRGSRVADTQSGFRAYNRRAIESLAADGTFGDNMGASTDILHHAHNHDYSMHEVPTTIHYDVENANSRNPLAHGLHLVHNILRTIERERPILTLGVPGVGSSLLGVGFGYWTFARYIDVGVFPIELAVAAAFLVLTGIFACFTAIILHSLNHHFEAGG